MRNHVIGTGSYLVLCALGLLLRPQHVLAQSNPPAQVRDGQHDFDWDIGTWKIHAKRRLHPLTGSTTWVEYNGTDVVSKIWDGRANLGQVEADGPLGHLELLTLRLYNPEARQWSMNIASSAVGVLNVPSVGEFKNGTADFVDQEVYNGRTILLRFGVSVTSPTTCRFIQSFSADGGKTWEENFVVDETRVA